MDRRESLKILFIGGVASSFVLHGCRQADSTKEELTIAKTPEYGRTPEEKAYNEKIAKEKYLTKHEFATITALVDIILPGDDESPSASKVGVPEFIKFMIKDNSDFKLPFRGGLKWLDRESQTRFKSTFIDASKENQLNIIDDIAYPDEADEKYSAGVHFFTLLRNLTLTGYFTSKEGIAELGYQGNRANFWDGVPQEVLEKHNLHYDEKYLPIYITQEKSREIMNWDNEQQS